MNNKYIEIYGDNFLILKEILTNLFGKITKLEYSSYDTGLETFFLEFQDEINCEINIFSNVITTDKSAINQKYICLSFLNINRKAEDKLRNELINGGYTLLT